MLRTALLSGLLLFAVTCSPVQMVMPDLDGPVQQAVAYLWGEFNPTLGLLRESPETAPDKYWLATDNWLAAHTLRVAKEDELARRIDATLARYTPVKHGVLEALAGQNIEWPPSTSTALPVTGQIFQEVRTGGALMLDWQDYTDLAFYAALDAYNEGRFADSRKLYRKAVQPFDGAGFADKAFDGRYTTYKLALALYIGDILDEPVNLAILQALLAKQADSGGFTAHYDPAKMPVGDTNTETTAYALLAMAVLSQP